MKIRIFVQQTCKPRTIWKLERFCSENLSENMQKCKYSNYFRRCKKVPIAKRPQPVFGPNRPCEMLENTGWTFCRKILKKWHCWSYFIARYIKVKRKIWNFTIKPNTRRKLGMIMACHEVKLSSTYLYRALTCAVPPWPERNSLLGSKVMQRSVAFRSRSNCLQMPYDHQIW